MPSAPPAVSVAARTAAAITAVEAIGLLVLAGGYLVGVEQGAEDSLSGSLGSIALFLVGAVLLAAMTRAWLTGGSWQRMATLVINALLVPVALTSIRAWGMAVGIPVLVVAITGVVAAMRAGDPASDTADGH